MLFVFIVGLAAAAALVVYMHMGGRIDASAAQAPRSQQGDQEREAGASRPGPPQTTREQSAGPSGQTGAATRINLPKPLQPVAFGISSSKVAAAFPVAWRRETRDALTLVHYLDKPRTTEARFIFREDRLQTIELRYKASGKTELAALYDRLQKEGYERYGSLPGSSRTRWTDGRMVARIQKERDCVALLFSQR